MPVPRRLLLQPLVRDALRLFDLVRIPDARRRLVSYQLRGEGEFAFADELAAKRRQLAEIERALALDVERNGEGSAVAA